MKDIYFQHINVENGLSQTTAFSLYQDEFGIIWIGTRDGLNYYDGNKVKVYKPVSGDPTSLFGNNIENIVGDKKGSIYIKCKNGLVKYDLKKQQFSTITDAGIYAISYGRHQLWVGRKNKVEYLNDDNILESFCSFNTSDIEISSLLQSKNGQLFIGTKESGLYLAGDNKVPQLVIDSIGISSIYEDSKENIWIASRGNGLYLISKEGKIHNFRYEPEKTNSLPSNIVRCIVEDNFGFFWIGTMDGLVRFDQTSGTFARINSADNISQQGNYKSVISIIKDEQGSILSGTYHGGIRLFNPEFEIYKYYYAGKKNRTFQENAPTVGQIIHDSSDNLWITTEGGGISYYNRNDQSFKTFASNPNTNSISSDITKSIYLDSLRNQLWIGTIFAGLDCYLLDRKQFVNYRSKKQDTSSLSNNSIRKIIGTERHLYLATHKGICIMDLDTHVFSKIKSKYHSSFEEHQILDMVLDKQYSQLWFSCFNGLYKYHITTGQINYYPNNIICGKKSYNRVNSIFKDSKGRLWLGTSGEGLFLYDYDNDSFHKYEGVAKQLANEYVIALNESKMGCLLVATNRGLFRIDIENDRLNIYNQGNGFPISVINDNSIFVARNGEIFIGGINGMVSFYEKALHRSPKNYQINFTNLEVNNMPVKPNDGSGLINEALGYLQEIKLNHYHKTFSIEFATTNFVKTLETEVEYMLEGFDQDWVTAGYRRLITYTNLNPGKYTLFIRGRNPDSNGLHPEKRLSIIIEPPFYESNIAYLIYILITGGIIAFLMHVYTTRIRLKASIEYEKREKEQINLLNQSKLKFFINISHEFRTPLTLISGQAQQLLQTGNVSPHIFKKLVSIERNVKRMSHLIDELLDFRKQELGFNKLKVSHQNVIPFLEEIYTSFKEFAQYKNINYLFIHHQEEIDLYFDTAQLEKAIYNILSNAFKYTPDSGRIVVSAEVINYKVYIRIEDSGIGIPTDACKDIFTRFYQVENESNDCGGTKGTGIGLSFAKSIIDAHQGAIEVESEINKGTIFTIILQQGIHHLKDAEVIESPNKDRYCINHVQIPEQEFISEIRFSDHKEKRPYILIVEDNQEVLQLLFQLFENLYNIYTATNGQEGVEIATKHQPDIILSDIMMPVMSGTEMCIKIKSNPLTCHIPIVLLTAKAAIDYTIDGLQKGADDYISKPFHAKELIMRCNNIVNSRRLLQERYASQPDSSPQLLTHNNYDQELIEKVIRIIEDNIHNPDFNIDVLSREIGLGRTNLFAKIKGITGQTPNNFIMNTKLKRGMQLLTSTNMDISEIAYELGFNSPSYFIKVFKDLFGATPASYRKKELN